MRNWRNCCAPSPPCRCEWRPSPLITAGLLAGTLLAIASLLLSDLPPPWRLPACSAAGLFGLWHACRWQRQRPRQMRFDRHRTALWVDGVAAAAVRISWRTGLLLVRWQGQGQGGWQHCLFVPAQLSPLLVRELRQWPRHRNDSPDSATMAP